MEDNLEEQLKEETAIMYETERVEEEPVDIKPVVLQLQNIKQEIQDQEPQPDYDTANL